MTSGLEVRKRVSLLTGLTSPLSDVAVIPNWHMFANVVCTPSLPLRSLKHASFQEDAPAGCSNRNCRPCFLWISHNCTTKARCDLAWASPARTFAGSMRGKFHLMSTENHVQGGVTTSRSGFSSSIRLMTSLRTDATPRSHRLPAVGSSAAMSKAKPLFNPNFRA